MTEGEGFESGVLLHPGYTLYEFDLTNGNIVSTKGLLQKDFSQLELGSADSLVGIRYNGPTQQYELRRISIATGASTLLKRFTFGYPGAYGDYSTLLVNTATQRAYAVSEPVYEMDSGVLLHPGNTLYEFDLTNGNIVRSVAVQCCHW